VRGLTIRPPVALGIACSLLAGCTGPTSVLTTPSASGPSPPSVTHTRSAPPSAEPAETISLPPLPPQGFAMEPHHADGRSGNRVVLVNLRGVVVARLPGFSIDRVSDRPGVVLLRRQHQDYLLDADQSSLRPISRHRIDTITTSEDLKVPLGLPTNVGPHRVATGHWRWMDLAPNGNAALAQWSGECEFPVAFVVPVQDGHPVPVTGASTLGRAPASEGLGWTRRGWMAVILPEGGCGAGTKRPGVYRFVSAGHGSFIFSIARTTVVRMWGPSSAPSQP
jgi:hypothetical protein